MKKLFTFALLSLGVLGLTTGSAHAGLFDGWCCNKWFCKKNCATLCVKPYNAFSPVAFGTLCLDGTFPLGYGCQPPCYYPGGFQTMGGPMYGGPAYCYSDCGPGGPVGTAQLPAPGSLQQGTALQVPPQAPPGFQPPVPAPMPTAAPPVPQAWAVPMPPNPVQPTGYQPNFYPGYGYPQMMPNGGPVPPWYWNGGR
jgi:hypothetical protein